MRIENLEQRQADYLRYHDEYLAANKDKNVSFQQWLMKERQKKQLEDRYSNSDWW